jgi:hypothetical protein
MLLVRFAVSSGSARSGRGKPRAHLGREGHPGFPKVARLIQPGREACSLRNTKRPGCFSRDFTLRRPSIDFRTTAMSSLALRRSGGPRPDITADPLALGDSRVCSRRRPSRQPPHDPEEHDAHDEQAESGEKVACHPNEQVADDFHCTHRSPCSSRSRLPPAVKSVAQVRHRSGGPRPDITVPPLDLSGLSRTSPRMRLPRRAHITTRSQALQAHSEPAIRARRATSAYVPIWRARRRSTGDVLCARSVRGG